MTLIDDLRYRRTASPTGRGFDIAAWLARGVNSDSADEAMLVVMGILFNRSLEEIRNELRYVTRSSIPDPVKRRELIAVANRDCLLAEVISLEQAGGLARAGAASADELSSLRISLPTGDFAAGEIAQTVVDGVGRLLQMCMGNTLTESPQLASQTPPDDLVRDFMLGGAYLVVEDLWQDVVWNDLTIRSGTPIKFAPRDTRGEADRVIGQYRHAMTTTQAAVIRAQRLKREVEAGKHAVPSTYKLIGAASTADPIELAVVDCDASTYADHIALLSVSIPEYYRSLGDSQSSLLSLLTLKKVVLAFLALRRLARDLAEGPMVALKAERDGSGPILTDLVALAPTVSKEELAAALERATGVSHDEAVAILNFLTLGAEPDRSEHKLTPDLWSSPLVSVAPDRLVLCLFPLLHVNLRWLVDVWLKRLGHPLDIRGTEFEIFALQALDERAAASNIASSVQVCRTGFLFQPSGSREEQIDLIIVVGSMVLVAELKCFLEPVTPVDQYNYRYKLTEAAAQVERKAAAVRSLPLEFIERARLYGLNVPESFDVVAAVVLNHAIGAGRVVQSVPIIDLRILEMFLENGMSWGATLAPDGTVVAGEEQVFYQSSGDAEHAFAGYLHYPPQLQHLRKALRARATGVAMPAAPGDHVVRIQLEIDPAKLETPSGSRPIGR